jgi:hypothetical protein
MLFLAISSHRKEKVIDVVDMDDGRAGGGLVFGVSCRGRVQCPPHLLHRGFVAVITSSEVQRVSEML